MTIVFNEFLGLLTLTDKTVLILFDCFWGPRCINVCMLI